MKNTVKKLIRKARKRYWTRKVLKSCGSATGAIHANNKTLVTKNTHLGNNVNFNGMAISGGGRVDIGDNFHSGPDCLMITQIHNFDGGKAIPYDNTYIYKDVVIDDNVWLGSRVIVLGGVKIGEGAVIQAGSVVVSDIPDFGIAGGHPAKVFKYRDVDHYNKIKSEGKFH